MVLEMPNVFSSGLFKSSPEDNQTLVYAGSRWLPQYLVNYRGDWVTSRVYNINDSVNHDGASYICILKHDSQEPPNATYWDVLAAEGAAGTTGDTGATGDTGEGYEFLLNELFPSFPLDGGTWDAGNGGGGSPYAIGSGVIALEAGNDNGGFSYVITDSSWGLGLRPYLVLEFNSLFEYNSDNDTNQFIGLMTSSDEVGDIDDCVGVFWDSSGFQAQLVTKKNGATTTSGYYSAGIYETFYTHHRLEISAEAVKWFVNGVLAATNTTNIPDDVNLKVLLRADCVNTNGINNNRVRCRDIIFWNDRN